MTSLAQNLTQRVHSCLESVKQACRESSRDYDRVKIVGASKTQNVDIVRSAYHLGVSDFGENYVQELLQKRSGLEELNIRWHFIGHLQSNKVKHIAPFIHCIHSVDSAKLAREISTQAGRHGRTIEILIQVNTSGEASKSGINADEVEELVRECMIMPHLRTVGLMTIPEDSDEMNRTRLEFRRLATLKQVVKENLRLEHFDQLSMGMSHDFDVAIQEGATMVRLGTALFGARS